MKPKGQLLTAALSRGYGGSKVPDSVFEHLDFVNIMAYDGYGNTEIMGRPFRPKGRFRGKAVFPVRGDVPIILTGSTTGFVLGFIFGLSLTARRSMRKHGKLLGGLYLPNGYGQKTLSSERVSRCGSAAKHRVGRGRGCHSWRLRRLPARSPLRAVHC
jgi:hypothetical protein